MLLYREAEAGGLDPSAATAAAVFLACYAEKQVVYQSVFLSIPAVVCSYALACGMTHVLDSHDTKSSSTSSVKKRHE